MKSGELTNELADERGAKNQKLENPEGGGFSFAYIPKNKVIEEGEVFLCLGYAGFGVDRKGAFGARHIWEKHKLDLGLSRFSDVPGVVSGLLSEGCNVLVDKSKGGLDKPIVVNTSSGMVSLQKKVVDEVVEYHVLTAYRRTNHPGIVVATLKKPK